MKKFLTLILCLAMVFAFTACGGGGSSAGGEDFVATACIASDLRPSTRASSVPLTVPHT